MSGCVLMWFGNLMVNVRRRGWVVTVPGKPEEAAYLESLGVGDRARMAVEGGEGRSRPTLPDECLTQQERLREAQERLRRRLQG